MGTTASNTTSAGKPGINWWNALPTALMAIASASSIFGDKKKDTTKEVSTSTLPPYLQPYVRDLLDRGQALSYRPYPIYPGERIAAFDPLQMQLFREAASLASKYGSFGSKEAKQYMSPYEQAVTNASVRAAREQARRSMAESSLRSAITGGYGGSGDAIMRATMARGLEQDVGDIVAKGKHAAYMHGLEQFQLDREEAYRRMQQIMGLGSLRQEQAQKGLDLAYQDFLRQRDYPKQMLSDYSSLIHGIPSPTDKINSITTPAPSLASQLLGTIPTAFALYKSGIFDWTRKAPSVGPANRQPFAYTPGTLT